MCSQRLALLIHAHLYICIYVMSSWQEQARRPSYAQVLRQLKRRECGLYNCINSVLADAAFVREIAALYPGFPVLANLRCGLWYVPEPAGTCYFKSTDGHFGQWAFSLTRLNLHLARLAAHEGGVLVVDATRRGKTFPVRFVACTPPRILGRALTIALRAATRHLSCVTPARAQDALAKTVPIWAAVLNRAVAAHRARAGEHHGGHRAAAPTQPQPCNPAGTQASAAPAQAGGSGAGSMCDDASKQVPELGGRHAGDGCGADLWRAQCGSGASQAGGVTEAARVSGGGAGVECGACRCGRCSRVEAAQAYSRGPQAAQAAAPCSAHSAHPCSSPRAAGGRGLGTSAAAALPRSGDCMCGCGCCSCGSSVNSDTGQRSWGLQADAGQRHDRQHNNVHAAHEAAAPPRCASRTRSGAGSMGAASERGTSAEAAWDTELHLPPWVTATERSQIEDRLDGFVRQLLEARPR